MENLLSSCRVDNCASEVDAASLPAYLEEPLVEQGTLEGTATIILFTA